ncbi:hypothetical protein A3844_27695 [Paenibacillus helianthi]|uniref:Uncharacterized protein n=1 Tax=Paenibacillus helianthi TaxID=1349432 RepID=A0ABX3EHP7_9BACL|nr:hypothetical protein [Paenibacillus helianthi]OKP79992.1 hypothetical protein A3844_27695 [Paenibacillus helianthi]
MAEAMRDRPFEQNRQDLNHKKQTGSYIQTKGSLELENKVLDCLWFVEIKQTKDVFSNSFIFGIWQQDVADELSYLAR